jgi:hypothetical protein
MNCPDVRAALPEFVYGGLEPAMRTAVESHVCGCPQCRQEEAALRQVRRLLAASPAPEVRLDAASLYREAAELQRRRMRRWRRVAVAACVAFVLAATATALARLEVHIGPSEMVLRWGQQPAPQTSPVAPQPPTVATAPVAAAPADFAAFEERLRVLAELTQALAEDGHEREYQRQQDIARLRAEIRMSGDRLGAMQKDFDALYIAQFANRKGVSP